jgi:hypothetical protein
MLDGAYRVIELDGVHYLTAVTEEQFEKTWRELRRSLAAHPLPAPLDRIRLLVQRSERSVGATLVRALWSRAEALLQIDRRGDRPRVVGYGTSRATRALALLRASPVPLPMDVLVERVGRFNPTDEMIFLERGVLAVEKHLPGFRRWQRQIVPEVRRILEEQIRNGGRDRHWGCRELLQQLEGVVPLPRWIGPWPLAGLLRQSGEFEYLGYLRVRLPAKRRRRS